MHEDSSIDGLCPSICFPSVAGAPCPGGSAGGAEQQLVVVCPSVVLRSLTGQHPLL